MPSVERRRLLKLGGSVVISLPPGWLAYYGLRVGDFVEVCTDGRLVLKPIVKRRNRGNAQPQI